MLRLVDIQTNADLLLNALDNSGQIECLSEKFQSFGLESAYEISDAITDRRSARGEKIVGIKIGFTNEKMWDVYGVHAPIFAPMYSSTLFGSDAVLDLSFYTQPKIEPEIYFRICELPNSDMSELELLACCSHFGHGIEVVQSVFPDWKFKAPDTVAAFGLHGAYIKGEAYEIPDDPSQQQRLIDQLQTFSLELSRGGDLVETGTASYILGSGPLNALKHLAALNERGTSRFKIHIGHVITTGTVTSAYDLRDGEHWSTRLKGLDIGGLSVKFKPAEFDMN